jgi:hypothetical protein
MGGAPWWNPYAFHDCLLSTKGEGVGLYAGIEEFDSEGAVADRTRLAHQLIQALAVDHAVPSAAVSVPWSSPGGLPST